MELATAQIQTHLEELQPLIVMEQVALQAQILLDEHQALAQMDLATALVQIPLEELQQPIAMEQIALQAQTLLEEHQALAQTDLASSQIQTHLEERVLQLIVQICTANRIIVILVETRVHH